MNLSFGFMSPPLSKQLIGTGVSRKDAMHFDRDCAAILRAHLRGYLTDRNRDVAFRKLVRAIEASATTPALTSAHCRDEK